MAGATGEEKRGGPCGIWRLSPSAFMGEVMPPTGTSGRTMRADVCALAGVRWLSRPAQLESR